MDFCLRHSPDEQWTMSHEQYRPFVLFHRIQASALAELEEQGPETAVHEVNRGLERMEQVFRQHALEIRFEDDELVKRLIQLRESLRQEYGVGRTLHERLADAVAAEQYELAAKLRDELARTQGRSLAVICWDGWLVHCHSYTHCQCAACSAAAVAASWWVASACFSVR